MMTLEGEIQRRAKSRGSIEEPRTRLFDNDDDDNDVGGRSTRFPDYRKVSSGSRLGVR